MRILALGVSLLTFLLSIFLYRNFDTAVATMQFVERVPWIESLSVEYYLGVDGISAPLIHYVYVRWAMRGAGRIASEPAEST